MSTQTTVITAKGKNHVGEQVELTANYELPITVDDCLEHYGEEIIVHAVSAYLRSSVQSVIRRAIAVGRSSEVQALVNAWKPGEAARVTMDPVAAFQKQLSGMDKGAAAQLLANLKAQLNPGE